MTKPIKTCLQASGTFYTCSSPFFIVNDPSFSEEFSPFFFNSSSTFPPHHIISIRVILAIIITNKAQEHTTTTVSIASCIHDVVVFFCNATTRCSLTDGTYHGYITDITDFIGGFPNRIPASPTTTRVTSSTRVHLSLCRHSSLVRGSLPATQAEAHSRSGSDPYPRDWPRHPIAGVITRYRGPDH